VLGKDNPSTLVTAGNLAECLRQQNKLHEAEALFTEALVLWLTLVSS
jgi:hypothetical protein